MPARSRRLFGAITFGALLVCLVVCLVVFLVVCSSATARAQPALPPPKLTVAQPTVVTFSPTQGDTLGGDAFDPLGPLALQPLRLGIFSSPEPQGRAEDCTQSFSSVVEASAFGMQNALRVRLLPRLTLYGFTRGGCPRDVAMGGAITYVAPISKDVFFVLSGGAIYLPAGPGGTGIASGQIRADLMIRRSGGRAWFVGIGSTGRHTGVTFSGTF
jgi:hypothetical protein